MKVMMGLTTQYFSGLMGPHRMLEVSKKIVPVWQVVPSINQYHPM
jgi:hypothetical protein